MWVQLKLIFVTSKRHKTTLLMATAIILNGDDYGMIIRWYTGITNSPVSPNSYVSNSIVRFKQFYFLASRRLIQIPGSAKVLKLQAFESRIQLKESEIPLMIGIWNSVSTNKECGIEYLELGIHTMESRIQDCLWLPCMRQLTSYDNWHLYHFPLTGKCLTLTCTDLYISLNNVIFSP